jgi:hypothetical protein
MKSFFRAVTRRLCERNPLMDNKEKAKKHLDTEPVVSSAGWGWVVFIVVTVSILAVAYFLKP